MRISRLLLLSLVILSNKGFGQITENLIFHPYVKSHTFYDSGSHKISDNNDAFCKGAGLNVYFLVKPKVRISAGYGLAWIDDLTYNAFSTKNAAFHQVDLNGAYSIFEGKRIQPLLLIGYAFNVIPDLKDFDASRLTTNLNLGYGVDVKVNNYASIIYSNTYGVSLSEDFRYNFRHQLGVGINFNAYQSKQTKQSISDFQRRIEYDLNWIERLELQVDSLTEISNQVTAKTVENYRLKQSIDELSQVNTKLELEKLQLISKNAYLLDSLRKVLFFSDSIVSVRYSDFYMLDSMGNIAGSLTPDYANTYYVAITNYNSFIDASSMLLNSELNGFESPQIVYHAGCYAIMSALTKKREEVIPKWNALTNKAGNYKLYKF